MLKSLFDRTHRADTHNFRITAYTCVRNNFRQWFHIQLFYFFSRHQDCTCGSVHDARGGGCGDKTAGLKQRFHRFDFFECDIGLRMFILLKKNFCSWFFARHLNRSHLCRENAFGHSCFATLLRKVGIFIHLIASDRVFFAQVFSCDRHRNSGIGVGQGRCHTVFKLARPHAKSRETNISNHKGYLRHLLNSTRQNTSGFL